MKNMDTSNNCGCKCDCKKASLIEKKILTISWQRLISDGNTCPRCGSTEDELGKAVEQLKKLLAPQGIEVNFEKKELTSEEFINDPIKSNRIIINGRLLEELVNAKTGSSQCCDVCGDEECRTVEIGDKVLETVPAELIVKAGLVAAENL